MSSVTRCYVNSRKLVVRVHQSPLAPGGGAETQIPNQTMGHAPMAPEEGSASPQGVKEPFVGKVVGSYVNHDCEACNQDGLIDYLMENDGASREEAEAQAERDFDHFMEIKVFEPEKYAGKTFHVLGLDVPESGNFESKWMIEMGFLYNIYGNLEDNYGVGKDADSLEEELEDIAEFLTGKVFKFRDIGFTEDELHPYAEYVSDAEVTFKEIGEHSSSTMNPLTVPVEEVDAEEYGEPKDTGDVEEVEFD